MATTVPGNLPPVNYPTNLKGINTNSLSPANTVNYFNNFFNAPIEVSSNINAAIISYFEQIADSKEGAAALASAVIYTSIKRGTDPMSTLDEFKKLPKGDLDTYTALFLNFERKGTSYLGISNQPVLNKYVQRTILP
jgi:hypothetical protein